MTSKLSTSEKIRIVLGRNNMTNQELADKLMMSRQNLHNKMKRGNFKEDDLEKIAEAAGVELKITFTMPDGSEI